MTNRTTILGFTSILLCVIFVSMQTVSYSQDRQYPPLDLEMLLPDYFKKTVEQLIDDLKSPDTGVRMNAALVLGEKKIQKR